MSDLFDTLCSNCDEHIFLTGEGRWVHYGSEDIYCERTKAEPPPSIAKLLREQAS